MTSHHCGPRHNSTARFDNNNNNNNKTITLHNIIDVPGKMVAACQNSHLCKD